MQDLKGKVALVTGAGGKHGMGRAIARRLAQEGADVAINDIAARREGATDWAGLPDVEREIVAAGQRALSIVADVSVADDVDAMVSKTLDHFGRIDILVNNAGTHAGRDRVPVVDLEESEWDRIQSVNAKGTFLCSRAVARALISQGDGGRIINISSVSGRKGVARFAAYCASKFAVRGFTQALAQELGPHGITVNAICPGFIETERTADIAAAMAPDGADADQYLAEMRERGANNIPLGRVGYAKDVEGLAAFLASADSEFMTGLSLNVAGGAMMD